jgi:hypothetical protein
MQISRKISFSTSEIDRPYAVGWGWATTVIVVLETETETDVTVIVRAACVGHEGMEIIVELAGNVIVSISDIVVGVLEVMTEEIADEEAPLAPGAVYTGLFPGSVEVGPLSPISSG